jgi:hypothetical protein
MPNQPEMENRGHGFFLFPAKLKHMPGVQFNELHGEN